MNLLVEREIEYKGIKYIVKLKKITFSDIIDLFKDDSNIISGKELRELYSKCIKIYDKNNNFEFSLFDIPVQDIDLFNKIINLFFELNPFLKVEEVKS